MESNAFETIHPELPQLILWLKKVLCTDKLTLEPMVADASFRRYFRIRLPAKTYVLMDAHRAQESCSPFIAIADALRSLGLHTPEIIAAKMDKNWLVLTDFGDTTLLAGVNPGNADLWYKQALADLAMIQKCQPTSRTLPVFNDSWMHNEFLWHEAWFIKAYLNLEGVPTLVHETYQHLIESAIKQPQVFMYRDFHAGNLMMLPHHQLGLLDFQDAFMGPLTYDLASLLRDCYIEWPKMQVLAWVNYFFALLQETHEINCSQNDFMRWFDYMGIQRHLKALMTFARKYKRDGDKRYLQYIPRTLNYIQQVAAEYKDLAPLYGFYHQLHSRLLQGLPQ